MAGRVAWRRRVAHEEVHERLEVAAGVGQVEGGRARPRVGVDDGELDLVLVGAEVHEELVDGVDDLGRRGRRSGRSC